MRMIIMTFDASSRRMLSYYSVNCGMTFAPCASLSMNAPCACFKFSGFVVVCFSEHHACFRHRLGSTAEPNLDLSRDMPHQTVRPTLFRSPRLRFRRDKCKLVPHFLGPIHNLAIFDLLSAHVRRINRLIFFGEHAARSPTNRRACTITPEYLRDRTRVSVNIITGPHEQVADGNRVFADENMTDGDLTYIDLTYIPADGTRSEVVLAECVHSNTLRSSFTFDSTSTGRCAGCRHVTASRHVVCSARTRTRFYALSRGCSTDL
jgi:hypothetical protein